MSGSNGWITGYVVPVMSGALRGSLNVDGTTIDILDGDLCLAIGAQIRQRTILAHARELLRKSMRKLDRQRQ